MERNYAPNFFSMYDPTDEVPIFQIDANLGFPAALLVCTSSCRSESRQCAYRLISHQNGLIQAPDVPSLSSPLVITLLPALPNQWPTGSIKAARVRGGMSLDMTWSSGALETATLRADSTSSGRKVQVVYRGKVLANLSTAPGAQFVING